MNVIREISRINDRELELNVPYAGSWHSAYQSSYVFIGGLDFRLTEGDVIAVLSQFGEIVDCVLIRDDLTGKSKGFGFVAYEDRRSCALAIDNLNGSTVLGRVLRVDHAEKYRRPRTEQEKEALKKHSDAEFARWEASADAEDIERRKMIWDHEKWPPVISQSNNQAIKQPSGSAVITRLSASPSLINANQSSNQSVDPDAQRLQTMLDKQRERRERMEREEAQKNEPKHQRRGGRNER